MKCSVENNGAELNEKCDGEINGLQKGVEIKHLLSNSSGKDITKFCLDIKILLLVI